MTAQRTLRRWSLTAAGIAVVLCYLFPLYWMYASSFKSPIELFASPPTFYPHEPWFDAYRLIISRGSLPYFMANSLFLSASATFVTLLFAVPAAYGLSRVGGRWLQMALTIIMLSQVLPPALLVTPLYVLFRQLALTGTYAGAILAFVTKALPFALVVLRPMFLQIPTEIDEAARVDGCSRFSVVFRIIMPVARTAIVVTGTLVFMLVYGEYVYASAMLTQRDMQPATVGLYTLIGAEQSNWNEIMAFCALFVTPMIVLFIATQKILVRGVMSGGGK